MEIQVKFKEFKLGLFSIKQATMEESRCRFNIAHKAEGQTNNRKTKDINRGNASNLGNVGEENYAMTFRLHTRDELLARWLWFAEVVTCPGEQGVHADQVALRKEVA